MRTALYVLTFALLMAALTSPARASDDPRVVYVLPAEFKRQVDDSAGRVEQLERQQRQQQDINARLLAELKALRADVAAGLSPAATPANRAEPAAAKPTGDPTCSCNSATTQCGCLTKYAACPCAKPSAGVTATAPFAGSTRATPARGAATQATPPTSSSGPPAAGSTGTGARSAAPAGITSFQLGGCANGSCGAAGYVRPNPPAVLAAPGRGLFRR